MSNNELALLQLNITLAKIIYKMLYSTCYDSFNDFNVDHLFVYHSDNGDLKKFIDFLELEYCNQIKSGS